MMNPPNPASSPPYWHAAYPVATFTPLLEWARRVAETTLAGNPLPDHPNWNPPLDRCAGLAVSFWETQSTGRKNLRACWVGQGYTLSTAARLIQQTQNALQDVRFAHRIEASELGQLQLAISLLHPLIATSPRDLQPKTQGILLKTPTGIGFQLPYKVSEAVGTDLLATMGVWEQFWYAGRKAGLSTAEIETWYTQNTPPSEGYTLSRYDVTCIVEGV